MILSFELEIKTLLEELKDPEAVAEKLIQLFDESPENGTSENLNELCRFMLVSDLHYSLVRFCLRKVTDDSFEMPWPYFIETLRRALPTPDTDVIKWISLGLEEDQAQSQAVISKGADVYLAGASQLRKDLLFRRQRQIKETKDQMMSELLTLRTQLLYEQERNLLQKLQRMFPGDPEILEELREHKERYALDILTRRSPLAKANPVFQEARPSAETLKLAENISQSLLSAAQEDPDSAYELAVAAYMLEEPQTSLAILETIELNSDQIWFYLEVKIKCRHFLEVLNEVSHVETVLAHEPETFFASAYLRAQAYWGLAQKHVAIEILESILAARPHYRSTSALLQAWRSQ